MTNSNFRNGVVKCHFCNKSVPVEEYLEHRKECEKKYKKTELIRDKEKWKYA